MLGTLHAVQAAATLIWDMSFTGTSSSPNADNIAVTDCNGASYSGITPSFGGGSVTDGIYNSSDSRLTFRDNASLLSLNNSFSFVVKASLNGEGTTNWSVLFGLEESSNWNLKVNYTKGDNDGWGFAPEGYSVTQAPYPIISYKQAMLEFGTDKPDLRNPLRIIDVTEFFQRCTFKPFKGRTVRAIKVNRQMSKGFHEKLLKFAQSIGMGGLGYLEVMEDMSYKGPIDKFIPDDMKVEMKELADLSAGDTIFFIADKEARANLYAGQIRTELGEKLDLIEKNAYRFCYINDFPMFELDEETKQIGFTHNPFSMPQGGLEALKTQDPLTILAYQYDIVCNGVELSSGAVRNHDMEIMVKAFEIAGYDEETLKNKFGALYNAFQFGAPPHAGMAPGVDRMIMLLCNEENIREVIAFPMSGSAQDLMCGAPNDVTEQQLREVHIKVRD